MIRSVEDILRNQLGAQAVQIAILISENDKLQEELKQLKDETKRPETGQTERK